MKRKRNGVGRVDPPRLHSFTEYFKKEGCGPRTKHVALKRPRLPAFDQAQLRPRASIARANTQLLKVVEKQIVHIIHCKSGWQRHGKHLTNLRLAGKSLTTHEVFLFKYARRQCPVSSAQPFCLRTKALGEKLRKSAPRKNEAAKKRWKNDGRQKRARKNRLREGPGEELRKAPENSHWAAADKGKIADLAIRTAGRPNMQH